MRLRDCVCRCVVTEERDQQQAGERGANELGDPIQGQPACGKQPLERESKRHNRVDVQAGDIPDGIDEGHHEQSGRDGPRDGRHLAAGDEARNVSQTGHRRQPEGTDNLGRDPPRAGVPGARLPGADARGRVYRGRLP